MRVISLPMPKGRGHALDGILRRDARQRPKERLPYAPSMEALTKAAEKVRGTATQDAVIETLEAHNEDLGNPAARKLCERLRDPSCLVVMCGQQPGLFGGPLMVAAKIAGAVSLARSLETTLSATGHKVPVVPIFWNLSEDHDLEEVNRFETLEGSEVLRERGPIPDLGRCFDQIVVGEELRDFASEQVERSGIRSGAEPLLPMIGESFPRWSSRSLLHVLGEGTPVLHAEPHIFRPFLQAFFEAIFEAFDDPEFFSTPFQVASAAVRDAGYEPQLDLRDSSPFFLVGEDGRRLRVHRDGGWQIVGEEHRSPEGVGSLLRRTIVEAPERISGNVILRPLAQQHLFPVVAHVNGPAEVAYFAQLPELFGLFPELPLPAVIPRLSLTLMGPRQRTLQEALAISDEDLLRDPERWPDVDVGADLGSAFQGLRKAVGGELDSMEGLADHDSLKRAVEGCRKRMEAAISGLEGTFTKDRERRAGVGRDRRRRLAQWVQPRGRPQERLFGALTLLRGGDPRSLGRILAALDPLDFRHHLVMLEAEDLELRP